MQWTAGQQAAIEARNDSILVSAAAGSGKTAVLTERVLSLLREGKQLDRMLIVTFTRAAAAEMRERIGRRLEEEGAKDAHLRRQALRINRAPICTLHVYCNRLIRRHFEAAGIDPMAKIGEESRLNTLRARARDKVMEALYEAPDDNAQALISQFEDEQICALSDSLYTFLMARAHPFALAQEMTEDSAADIAHWLPLLRTLCASALHGAAELIVQMEAILNRSGAPLRYAPVFEADRQLTEYMIACAENGTLCGGKTAFERLSTKRAGSEENPELAAQFKALREEWKKRIQEARSLLPEDIHREQANIRHTLPALRGLLSLTQAYHEAYSALKRRKNLLDYTDLEHLALRALSDPAVRAQAAGSFDALFIDEYQDVSAIQEAIIAALHVPGQNSLFMVGDVKQSIYRFRQAEPALFLEKYRAYALDENAPCRKILLQQNFRSDENILRSVNQVFSHAMREKETEIEYDEAAMLRPGGNQSAGAAVEIHLMHAGEAEEGESEGELAKGYQYEAAFVARRIRELMRTATVRDAKGTRPLRYRDIALLLRSASGRAPFIARLLQGEGIPVYSDADAQYYDLPEVRDLLSLLQVIANPLQDLPLLSALRCPCFALSEEELARIRLVERAPGTPFYTAFLRTIEKGGALGGKCKNAWDQLAQWRFLSRNLPVDALVRQVMEESGLYMCAGAMEDGELRQANLRLLCEQAGGEAAINGLSAFLKELGRLRTDDNGKAAKTLGENEDVVRILTLHKSKGLEFPVVFLLETARPFRGEIGNEALLRLHSRYGMALQYIDGEHRIKRDTCALTALKGISARENRAEEARLLYVGMTRARERLILVGSPRRLSKSLEKWARPASAFAAGSASCMLDWVMQSLGGYREGESMAMNGSIWRMEKQCMDESGQKKRSSIPVPTLESSPPDEKTRLRLGRTLEKAPPLKTSVTAVAHPRNTAQDEWESPADKRALPIEAPRPAFLLEKGEISALQRGTITHRVLGLVSYDWMRKRQWQAGIEALLDKGLLSPAEKDAVRMRWICNFFLSDYGKRALAAQTLHREWAFNARMEGGGLMQGVIDLCFLEDGQWVLIDYKTDAVPMEELPARYALQLRLYAAALAKITQLPVKEALLFSLRQGDAIAVPLSE